MVYEDYLYIKILIEGSLVQMRKIFKIFLVLCTISLGIVSMPNVNAINEPRYKEGENTFHDNTVSISGLCTCEITGYVKVGYYQTASEGAYIKILSVSANVCGDGIINEVGSATSSPAVNSKIKAGSTVIVYQKINCSKHGTRILNVPVTIG